MVTLKRGILVVGCAVACAAAPLVVASPAVAKTCPYGTVERFEGVCTPGGQQGGPVLPPESQPAGPVVVNNQNGYSSVAGIPCTAEHMGTCIALQQSGGGG